jgi:SET domain-containing protein
MPTTPTVKRRYVPGQFELHPKRSAAGVGLFAGEDIPKGACVIEYFGPCLTNEEADRVANKYLFAVSSRRTIDGSPRENVARYINHSCRPNCEADIHRGRVFIFARRAIKAGEELAYNYGKDYFDSFIKPYGCRCPKCTEARAAEGARAS